MKKFKTIMSNARNKIVGAATAFGLAFMSTTASAVENVTVNSNSTANPFDNMGKMIGLLLSVVRYVGVAMVIYGVYEFVQGITVEGQMEKKTKGIIWVFAGLLMTLLKWILGPTVLNVIG